MRNSTRNYVKLIIHGNCFSQAWPPKTVNDTLMKQRYEEAFGLIKYIFNVDELRQYQIRLIKAFVSCKNIYFNAPTGNGSPAYKVNHFAGR